MRMPKRAIGWFMLTAVFIMSGAALRSADKLPTPNYTLSLAAVYESNPMEWEFVFGGTTVCKTVASLKRLVAVLPSGSTLDWSSGCERLGGEPLLSSEHDMADFKEFCKEKGISLVIHPAG